METFTKYFLTLILGIFLGYSWCIHHKSTQREKETLHAERALLQTLFREGARGTIFYYEGLLPIRVIPRKDGKLILEVVK